MKNSKKFEARKNSAKPKPSFLRNPQSATRIAHSGRDRAPGFHPRFRHAALPAHAETFCLCQNRRGLQPSVQLLHHSADARLASQPPAGRYRGRGQGVHCRRREGNQSDFAGLDLLRTGFAPEPQPRDFVAGEIFRRRQIARRRCHDHLHAAARTEFAEGRFLDSPALHASGALDGGTHLRRLPTVKRWRAMWTCRSSTSTKTCSNGCAAKRRSNTSWI